MFAKGDEVLCTIEKGLVRDDWKDGIVSSINPLKVVVNILCNWSITISCGVYLKRRHDIHDSFFVFW